MKIKVKFDAKKFEDKLRQKQKEVKDAYIEQSKGIHNFIHIGVWDNTHWNPSAYYSPYDEYNAGEPYDLVYSGKWRDLLEHEPENIQVEENRIRINYGSVELMDSNMRYWRYFVYGKPQEPNKGYTPVYYFETPNGLIKSDGYVRDGNGMRAIEPTWMFDVWHQNSGDTLEQYVKFVLDKAWSKK